jgi:hypothetical protein
MVKDLKFKLGEIVYLKTDSEQLPRMVTEISILGSSMSDCVTTYDLSQGEESSEHYSSEIIKTKDTNLKLGI